MQTKKHHGQNCPWVSPAEGVTGKRGWAKLIIDMMGSYKKLDGSEQSSAIIGTDRARQLIAAEPSSYATARRKLSLVCVTLGGPEYGRYAVRSPKNLLPTAVSQMEFSQRVLNIIGCVWRGAVISCPLGL